VLRWRLIIGVGLVAALAALCWLDARAARPGVYLAPLSIVAAVLAAGEMLRVFRARGEPPAAWSVYVGVLLPVAASGAAVIWHDRPEVLAIGRLGWLALGLAAGMIMAFLAEMRRYEAPGRSTASVAQAALAVLYVGGLVGMLVQLRLAGIMPTAAKPAASLVPLLSMIATVKLSDIGQYVVGRSLGRRKLAPRISPGKTWEGALGGIGIAALTSAIVLPLLLYGSNGLTASRMLVAGAFALTLAVAGLAGDLSESLLKRDAGVKDSSDWLPGFGGVLDLLDSLLFAAPVAYLWWASGAL
jgi:phosphatidate cytidylyltransferase